MDWQAAGVGGAAVLTAAGTLIAGIYSGRNSRRKDQSEAEMARERAEEVASRIRIEAIASDLIETRRALREKEIAARAIEEEYEVRLRKLRKDSQRAWDLASYHFSLVTVMAHLFNNLFTVITMGGDADRIVASARNCQLRMKDVRIPITLEEPIPVSE